MEILDFYLPKTKKVTVCPTYYRDGNFALQLKEKIKKEWQSASMLTVNLGIRMRAHTAFIDVNNNMGHELVDWLEKNYLGKRTGRYVKSGFVEYPEFSFDETSLTKFTTDEYAQYKAWCCEKKEGMELYIPICLKCGKAYPISVTPDAAFRFYKYQMGHSREFIQDIFPEVPSGIRELLRDQNGSCAECWKEMFGDPIADGIEDPDPADEELQ